MKKIILTLSIVVFSGVALAEESLNEFAYGRTQATGTPANGDGQPVEESADMDAGSVAKSAGNKKKICETCMTAGKNRMYHTSRNAKPGTKQGPATNTGGSTAEGDTTN